MENSVRFASRAAAVLVSAAVLLPVPALVAPASAAPPAAALPTTVASTAATTGMAAAPRTANTAAGRARLAAWTARDARAKATIAHVAKRRYARALGSYRARGGARLRAAAAWARRDAAAKATIAHLAGVRATRAARAARPARARVVRASRSRTRAAVSSNGVWDRLARCEAGGNWGINTGNGYYGGLQFSASSWRAVGGSGLPHRASRAEQIRRGQMLQARQGWGAWPACSRKLGLR